MQEKSVTLTPNKRLARHLQKQFCAACCLQNRKAWQSPTILPIKTWLVNCWLQYQDRRILLNPHQERLLWQKIIVETLGEKFISLTNIAMEACELTNSWLIEEPTSPTHESEDIVIFQRINKEFKKLCEDKNFVTTSQLPLLIIPYLHNYNLKQITLAGFDEYNPQLQKLISAIKETGCEVIELDPNNCQNSIKKKTCFSNLKEEITNSAKWAKQLLNKNNKSNIINLPRGLPRGQSNGGISKGGEAQLSPLGQARGYTPGAVKNSIGIVVPNLVNLRPKISQIFSEIIGDEKAVNVSTGTPMNSMPIINSALNLLSLLDPLEVKNINKILSAPYISGAETEKSSRALLNLKLNELNKPIFSLTDIKSLSKDETPLLIKILEDWHKIFAQTRNKALLGSEWLQLFTQILQCFGWPGENNLTDVETNAIDQFTKVLQEIASTDRIIDKISYKKALKTLYGFVANSTLQPQQETESPINIIGSLEAAGLNFDHLWIMGLDQENWPPAPHPNPFISIEVQKKFSLPHSSAQRELHFCEMLIERYKRSAKDIVFSYVKHAEDHQVESSSLISDIEEISSNDLSLTDDISAAQKIYNSKKIEQLEDNLAPRVNPDENLHTGSKLIELQSLCPFQAFVEFRLNTKEPQKPEPGITRIQRGIVIHDALEKFWQTVKTQQNLLEMDPIELENLIKESIETPLNKLSLIQALYEIEKECLIPLLTRWIELEKTRLPFQVTATEKTAKINLANLPISLRIDRIDQIAGGNTILIDYKTGKTLPSTFDWFSDRPKNIQLLLYSVALGSVQGIALAQINTESLKFREIGLKELSVAIDKNGDQTPLLSEPSWDNLIKYWHDILDKLAADFASGKASPTPISPQICKQCSFGSICRVSQA